MPEPVAGASPVEGDAGRQRSVGAAPDLSIDGDGVIAPDGVESAVGRLTLGGGQSTSRVFVQRRDVEPVRLVLAQASRYADVSGTPMIAPLGK